MSLFSGENILGGLAIHVVSVIILAMLAALACKIGRFRPSICHALWLVVLIKLMVPPVIAWPWQMDGVDTVKDWVSYESVSDVKHDPNDSASKASTAPPNQPTESAPVTTVDFYMLPLTLCCLWLAGAFAFAGIQMARVQRLRKLIDQGTPAPAWLQQRADRLADEMGVKRPRLMLVPHISSALAWNPRRPQILISEHFMKTVDETAWPGILVHELAHFKRRDLWLGWLELLATCVWWWNPILLIVRRQLHAYAEMACDAWVAVTLPETRRMYAETLVHVVDLESQQPSLMPALGMANGAAVAFEKRLAIVLGDAVQCRMPRMFIVLACALAVLVAPGWAQVPSEKDKAAASAPTPEPIADSGEAITADTGIRFQMYFVRAKIDGLPEHEPCDMAKDNAKGVPYRFGLTGLLSKTIQVAGVPVKMDGPTLLWGEDEQPQLQLPGVVHIASPEFSVIPDEWVTISANVPAVTQPWHGTSKPFDFTVKSVYDSYAPEEGKLRLLLAPSATKAIENSLVWTAVYVSVKDTWQALVVDVVDPNNKKNVGTLLIYWRAKSIPGGPVPSPGQEVIDSFNIGAYTTSCRMVRHEKDTRPTLPYMFRAEMKVIEGPLAEAEQFLREQKPMQATTVPEGIQVFEVGDQEQLEKTFDELNKKGGWELVTAPRVTFRPDELEGDTLYTKMFLDREDQESPPGSTNNDGAKMFEEFSPSLAAYMNEEIPRAVVMDATSETFIEPETKEEKKISHGLAAALGARSIEGTDTADIRLHYNCRTFERHYRGMAFWRTELMPDVIEDITEANFQCRFGHSVAMLAKSTNPKMAQIIFFTLTKQPSRVTVPLMTGPVKEP